MLPTLPILRLSAVSLLLGTVLLLGCGAAHLEETDVRPAVVATVIAAPPPAPAGDSHVSAAGPESDEPAASFLYGTWSEEFENRSGCQDQIEVGQSPSGSLRMSGVDCNDGEAYDFRDVEFDGRTVRIRVVVTSTNYELRYTMEVQEPDALEGQVEVDGGGSKTSYHVKWTRDASGERR